MNRTLQILNFIGVAALAVLCTRQWQVNTNLLHDRDGMARTIADQSTTLATQAASIKQDAIALDNLQQRLTTSTAAEKEATTKLADTTDENAKLKSAMDQWKTGVEQRDTAIKSLTSQRDDATSRYNDLVGKYNALVKEPGGK